MCDVPNSGSYGGCEFMAGDRRYGGSQRGLARRPFAGTGPHCNLSDVGARAATAARK
jgi:hypothetical protein